VAGRFGNRWNVIRKPAEELQRGCGLMRGRYWLCGVLAYAASVPLVASACHHQVAAKSYAVRDSAGIRIVVLWSLPDSPSIPLNDVPALSLGVDSGPAAETFDNIRGLVRLADGTVFVGDGGSNEVRSFSAKGEHLATFGGTGDGPAEFRGLGSIIALRGDSVAGIDAYTGKVAVFDRNGRFGRSLKVPRLRGGYLEPWVRGATSDDGLLLEWWRVRSPDFDRTASGYERIPVTLGLFSSSTFAEKLLGTLPGAVVAAHTSPDRLGVLLALSSLLGPPGSELPMRGGMVSAARGATVAAGTTDLSEIRVFHGAKLVQILRFAVKKRPVGSVRDRIRTAWLQRLSQHAQAELRDTIESYVKSLPDSMPVFGMIQVDAAGRVWVPRYEPSGWYETGPSLWWILGKSGLLVGSMALPADFTPYQIDDSVILGVQKDSMGVQRVREYAFGPL